MGEARCRARCAPSGMPDGASESPACPASRPRRSRFNRGASAGWAQNPHLGTPEGRSGAPTGRVIPAIWGFSRRGGAGGRKTSPARAIGRCLWPTCGRPLAGPPPEGVLVNGLTESEASDGEKSPKSEKLGSRGLSFSSKTPGRQFGTGARGGIWAVGPSDFGDFSPLGRVLLAIRSCLRAVSRLVASPLCHRAFRGNAPRVRAVRYDAPIRYDVGKGPA